jgi:hypothetical protein
MTNDGLNVNYEKATGKQWLAFHEMPFCEELMTWSMMKIDLLDHFTFCW